jgi:hypothetical protein
MPDIASRSAALHPLTRRLAQMVDAALAQAAARVPQPAAAAALAAQAGLVPVVAAPIAGRAVLAAPAGAAHAGLRVAAPYAVAPVTAPASTASSKLMPRARGCRARS